MDQTPSYTPYGPPSTEPTHTNSGQASTIAIDILRRTKGWVRFFSILGFLISIALITFGSISVINQNSTISPYAIGQIIGFLLIASIYFFPSLKLLQFASSISKLGKSENIIDLENALNQQRKFWKISGSIILITLILYTVIVGVSFLN